MKRLATIFLLIIACAPAWGQSHITRAMDAARAQEEARAREDYFREQNGAMNRTNLMAYMVENGDTTFIDYIDPCWCFGHPRNARKDWRKYYKLVYRFARVYPLALASGRLQEIVDSTIAADNMGALKKDRYIASVQEELFKDFEKTMRKMSINEGAVLLKLIDRETGQSSYSIIRQYKNGIAAGFWQGIAKLFDNDLKSQYDPEGEDKDMEELVQAWHDGTFPNLYYSIFFEAPPDIQVPDKYLKN